MAQHFSILVIGGGNAAGYLASALVDGGLQPGQLGIVTEELVVSYERPALSKAYLLPQGAARLPGFHTCVGGGGQRHDAAWYTEKGIAFLTGTKVLSVDLAGKTVTTAPAAAAEGAPPAATLTFDKLVIATGANAVRLSDFGTPGSDLPGLHYLRNVSDADALVAGIAAAKAAGNKAVVVGGGYIGLEVAAGLALNGLQVSMVFPDDNLMARILSPELAAFYERFYEAKGITLVKGRLAKAFQGDGKVSSVLLSDGSQLPADMVVVGAGARPASGLFKGQLATDAAGGITVDGSLQTSVPGVYAIGDVASFPLLCAGGASVRQEHVTHARTSAAHVAQVLLGKTPGPYDYLPYFYSRVFSLSWQFYGSNDKAEVITWGDLSPAAAEAAAVPGGANAKFGAFYVRDGRVVGGFIEGAAPEEAAALKALAAAPPAAPGDLAQLKEQGVAWALAAAAKL